jgi:predicted nucleic acid-binding protein
LSGVTLDAGALIAFERDDRRTVALLRRAVETGGRVAVPAGVVGQVWRDGRRQARVARLLAAERTDVVPLDDRGARAAGQLSGRSGTADVIDAPVALCARERDHTILTSDPDDLRRLGGRLRMKPV